MGCTSCKTVKVVDSSVVKVGASDGVIGYDMVSDRVAAEVLSDRPGQTIFSVVLERTKGLQNLGVTFSFCSDDCLIVHRLRPTGLIPSWNKKLVDRVDLRMKVGDRIVAVNGVVSDSHAMMKELDGPFLRLLVQRGDGQPNMSALG
eukprot:TRINITY_DN68317_c0_g1_i1.p2 TRINITY_DN68317_c0_g1~~TRINITY_DN68317_c0_g1_i1.p2  ORF type:complete len:146 (-),score=25.29 TRINITY_DN68317_c0_g1_i1:220-657(-)